MDDKPEATLRDVVDALDRLTVAVYCAAAPALADAALPTEGETAMNIVRFGHALANSTLVAVPPGADRLASMEVLVEELKAQLRLTKKQQADSERKALEAVAKYDRLTETVQRGGIVEVSLG